MKIKLCNAVLVSNVYCGEYWKKDNNFGHEIFNIIPADDKKFYGYINPKGKINDKRLLGNKNKKFSVVFINCNKTYAQIIGCYPKCKIYKIGKQNIKNAPVYFKKRLDEYFVGNNDMILNKKPDFFTTVKSEEFYYPKVPLTMPNISQGKYRKLANQSQKLYLEDKEIKNFQKEFKKYDFIRAKKGSLGISEKNVPTYIDMIGKDNDENIITKFLSNIIDDNKICQDFIRNFFGIREEIRRNDKIIVRTEYASEKPRGKRKKTSGRIDLLIKTPKNILVIENKVFSGINGKKSDQLIRYKKIIEESLGEKEKIKKITYVLLYPKFMENKFKKLFKKRCKESGFIQKTYEDLWSTMYNIKKTVFSSSLVDLKGFNFKLMYEDFLLYIKRYTNTYTKYLLMKIFARLRKTFGNKIPSKI